MTPAAPIQLVAILASLVYLWSIVSALRRSRMAVRQAVLWVLSGLFFLALSVFPQPMVWGATKLGFVAPSNAAFVAWLIVLTGLIFYQSLTTSRHLAEIKRLAQELAVLNAELVEAGVRKGGADTGERARASGK